MIMPKKKRMLVTTIVMITILIILLIITYIGLYMTTDLFKSKDKLFSKYLMKSFENVSKLFEDENLNEMKQIFQNNKYEISSTTKINYQEEEDENNSINNIKLVIDGKKEDNQQYDYQNISLKNDKNETLYGIEYLKNNNRYGIRLNGIEQFATEKIGENIEKKEGSLLSELAITSNEENKTNFLQLVANMNIKNTKFELTEEENKELQNKYLGIIIKNITKDNISRRKNINIEIEKQNVKANSYVMTLTKEELNNIYIEMLTQLKEDDIILSKIEELDNINHQYNVITNNKDDNTTRKEKFLQEIEEEIKEIQSTNIGNDTRKITVYETKMKPLGISIENNNSITTITTIRNENTIQYEYLKKENTEKENSINLKVEKIANENDDTINFEYNIVKDNNKITNYIKRNIKFDKDTAKTNLEIGRNAKNANIKINSQKEEKVVNEFKNKIEFNKKNSINIEEKNQEEKNSINDVMNETNSQQLNNVFDIISTKQLNIIMERLELKLEEAEDISGEGNISEIEKNRFNSNFEFFEGKNIAKESVIKLIDTAKNNLQDVRITKYKEQKSTEEDEEPEPEEYKLTIERNSSNQTLYNNLITNIQNSEDKEYNVKIEYSQSTGLVENIFIEVSN